MVPIIVGATNTNELTEIGKILFNQICTGDDVVVLASSDFCHWGKRYKYTFHNKEWGGVEESIEKLDSLGINAISNFPPERVIICDNFIQNILYCILNAKFCYDIMKKRPCIVSQSI